MIPVPLEDIEQGNLQNLVDNSVMEGVEIEYKQELPNSRGGRKTLVQELTSFANTRGGDLVYGIEEAEDSGEPISVSGFDIDDVDAERARLDSIVRDGVRPRIPSYRVQPIVINDNEVCFVIRAQQSLRSPHRVTLGGHDKFYARSSNGKYPLDVDELREQFLTSQGIAEDIRDFHADRIAKIRADETPVALEGGARIVLHLVPYNAFTPGSNLDISSDSVSNGQYARTFKRKPMSDGRRYNIDGVVSYWLSDLNESQYSYTQTFRSGIIEAVDEFLLKPEESGQLYIPSIALREYLEYSLSGYLATMESQGLSTPIYVLMAILDAEGYVMSTQAHNFRRQQTPIDRSIVQIPEQIVESYNVDLETVIDPIINATWNACGYQKEQ